MPNWQVVEDSIKFFVKYNAKGVMLQGNYQTPGTADGFMRNWIWAKMLWDPTLDTKSLMQDLIYGYYGKSAKQIWDYEELLWNMWEKEHNGKLKNVPGGIRFPMTIFDSDFMAAAKECFRKANILTDNDEIRRRVEESELQVLYAEIIQLSQFGKPSDVTAFKASLDRFEQIARRIKMTHIQEGPPDFENWIAYMRGLAK